MNYKAIPQNAEFSTLHTKAREQGFNVIWGQKSIKLTHEESGDCHTLNAQGADEMVSVLRGFLASIT